MFMCSATGYANHLGRASGLTLTDNGAPFICIRRGWGRLSRRQMPPSSLPSWALALCGSFGGARVLVFVSSSGFDAKRVFGRTRAASALVRYVDFCISRGLTFEVRRDRRRDARPRPQKMYTVPVAGAWWLAVGPRLDRGVRPHCAALTFYCSLA